MAVRKNDKGTLASPVQERFISALREAIPSGIGLAEEIASLLGVSTDSAYRRIRGETELTIDELFRITKKYHLSVDELFSASGDSVTFAYTKLTDSSKNFEAYLTRLVGHMQTLTKAATKHIYYVAEEMPLFYSFYSPLFADFKLFYWQRSVLNCHEFQQGRYQPGLVPQPLVDTGLQCYKEYLKIPSVEIWTDLTVLTGLRQVGFYFDSGVLDKEMTLRLLAEYRSTIVSVQKMAEAGRKTAADADGSFKLYSSEVVLGTNCIYTAMNEARYSFISFNTLNSLTTGNAAFCEETEHWVRNLEKKSTLISGIAEKQRYQFFNSMFQRIDEFTARVSAS